MPRANTRQRLGRRRTGEFVSWLVAAFMLVAFHTAVEGEVIRVPPGPADAVSRAVAGARPGDTVELLPGTYTGTVEVKRSGVPELPVVIAGASDNPEEFPVVDGGGEPGEKNHEGFRIEGAAWVTIRNLRFRNCWHNVVDIKRSSYISVQGCIMEDCGSHAIATQDKHGSKDIHHILAEGCTWSQNEKIWTTWDWAELHHGKLRHYNGGFYGARNAAGDAVIRRNTIRYVFNGLRWWMKKKEDIPGQSNIEVYENLFEYNYDNGVEPEVFTANMHVYHNTFNYCPLGVISIDMVNGGPIYFYGNVGLWEDKGRRFRSWTIYKFAKRPKEGGYLDEPLHIYHNSFKYREAFGGSGGSYSKAEDHIRHFNNAYDLQKQFGLVNWQGEDCRFNFDCSNRAWPKDAVERGFERNGVVGNPGFVDANRGDFRLKQDSRCVDRGKVIEGFTLWYTGQAPDIGAYEGGQLVYGMPFRHVDPPGSATYRERPRIVRCFARGKQLAIFFSTDLVPASITPSSVQVAVRRKRVKVKAVSFRGLARAPVLKLEKSIPDGVTIQLGFTPPPQGTNGMPATLWAADLKVVRIPPNATLVGDMRRLFSARTR